MKKDFIDILIEETSSFMRNSGNDDVSVLYHFLKYVKKTDAAEDYQMFSDVSIKSSFDYVGYDAKPEEILYAVVYTMHKACRQQDVFGDGNLDMILWHLMQKPIIYELFKGALADWMRTNNFKFKQKDAVG